MAHWVCIQLNAFTGHLKRPFLDGSALSTSSQCIVEQIDPVSNIYVNRRIYLEPNMLLQPTQTDREGFLSHRESGVGSKIHGPLLVGPAALERRLESIFLFSERIYPQW